MNDLTRFTKGERIAIITLAAVILLIIAANFFMANRPPKVNESLHNLDSIWALHSESLEEYKKSKRQSKKTSPHSPSTSKPKPKVKVQAPSTNDIAYNTEVMTAPLMININKADTLKLRELPNIGSFFAKNIVEYREKLGGFTSKEQLMEVYAFDSARFYSIEPHIFIDTTEPRKLHINHDNFKTILRHPYIEYEDVKKIVSHRESRGFIRNWDEYLKIVGRDDIDQRLKLYIEF